MNPESEPGDLFSGIMNELARVEKMQDATAKELAGKNSPADDKKKLPFEHVRDGAAMNPSFLKGVEFARLDAVHKLETMNPDQFIPLAEVEMDGIIAIRDTRKKSDLSPGENVYSRIVSGVERYQAKVRGRIIAIGNQFHVLPSDVDGKLKVRRGEQDLSAYMEFHPSFGKGRMPDLKSVREFLEANNIRYGIRESSILEALKTCALTRQPVTEVPVSKGFSPINGKPGSIEYFFDRDFQGPVHMDLDETGKIDFRNVKWIPIVTKDQLLARVSPGIPGAEGMDVSGRPLPAKPIPKAYLVAGRNVRSEKDDLEFYSEINGCVQLNGTLLAVMNVFVVNSDVDYHTGNIRFEGNILITGSVRKGFEVEAEGDLIILGNSEPCRIKAGRDIQVKGGVLGAGKGKFCLEAGRNIHIGYSENACLECHGDIVVENFSLQSYLYCSGHVLLQKKRGTLVGGEAMAAKGVESKALGSSSGVKTYIAAGVDFALKRQLVSLKRQDLELKEAMIKIDGFLRSLLQLSNKGTLPPSKVQALKEIVERRKQISKAHTAITVRRQELEFQQENLEPGRIKAVEVVHPEVFLTIRGRALKVVDTHYRARFYLDLKTDQILRGPA